MLELLYCTYLRIKECGLTFIHAYVLLKFHWLSSFKFQMVVSLKRSMMSFGKNCYVQASEYVKELVIFIWSFEAEANLWVLIRRPNRVIRSQSVLSDGSDLSMLGFVFSLECFRHPLLASCLPVQSKNSPEMFTCFQGPSQAGRGQTSDYSVKEQLIKTPVIVPAFPTASPHPTYQCHRTDPYSHPPPQTN